MSSRSLNKVTLIGNLTRDPELRYTPAGTAVCTFGLATNRTWTTQSGETKEETEFHRIVSWNKLGELCSQLLAKGRKVYVEGRLATHTWVGQDGVQRTTTEIVIEDMIILDSKRTVKEEGVSDSIAPASAGVPASSADTTGVGDVPAPAQQTAPPQQTEEKKGKKKTKKDDENEKDSGMTPNEEITPDDIPF